jgi:hypothetical protein
MSDTPETDFVRKSNDCDAAGFGNMMLHARKLERERDEARELAEQMSESNQVLLADVRFYRQAWEQLKEAAK